MSDRAPSGGAFVTGMQAVSVRQVADAVARREGEPCAEAYSAAEWLLYRDRPQSLAGRWAAKRAVVRALGMDADADVNADADADANADANVVPNVDAGDTPLPPVAYAEIEILPLVSGQPSIRLSGNTATRAAGLGLSRWLVTITHTREVAIAYVVGCRP